MASEVSVKNRFLKSRSRTAQRGSEAGNEDSVSPNEKRKRTEENDLFPAQKKDFYLSHRVEVIVPMSRAVQVNFITFHDHDSHTLLPGQMSTR